MSLSLPKQSKFVTSHGPRTTCWMGAGSVLDIKPSQSKPWYHLYIIKDKLNSYFVINYYYYCINHLLVFFDVLHTTSLVSKPFGRRIPAQLLYQTLRRPADVKFGKINHVNPFQNQIVSLHRIGGRKRRTANKNQFATHLASDKQQQTSQ